MDEHRKEFQLVVNGQPKKWEHEEISYEQVVDLAYPPPHKPTEFFSVQYRHGPRENPQGTLHPGQRVRVKDRMIFDVTRTDRS